MIFVCLKSPVRCCYIRPKMYSAKTPKNRYDDKQYFLKHSLSINYFQGINYQQQYPYRPCSGEKSKHMPICWTHKGQRYIK